MLMSVAVDMAIMIAGKSSVAVQRTKLNLVYSTEHSVEEGLDEVAMKECTIVK